jgi:TnpA family transposase
MASLHESAYPRLKPDPTAKELHDVYTPSAEETAFAAENVQRPFARLAFIIQMKLFQRLGYFMPLSEVPQQIREHIVSTCGFIKIPRDAEFIKYDTSGNRQLDRNTLRNYFNIRTLGPEGRQWLDTIAEGTAQTKNTIIDVINVLLEELVHHRYELPAFSTLHTIAERGREKVHRQYYEKVASSMTPAAKAMVDDMLKTPVGTIYSGWHALKREPKRPTNKEVRQYLQHVQRLKHLAAQVPAIQIPVPKLKYFRTMARALDAAELAELKPVKRYALAAIFIRSQYSKTLDDAADIFIRMMQNLENKARTQLIAHQIEHSKRADLLIGQLRDVLQAYQLDGSDRQRVDAIGNSLVLDIRSLLAECEQHMAYANRNFLPFLTKPFRSARPILFNCLEIMLPQVTSSDRTMERMISALKITRTIRADMVELSQLGLGAEKDFAWMSAQWRKLVFGKATNWATVKFVHRKYFELAVLFEIKDELKSGDLCIADGERYDDYREQLVDEETFKKELAEYGEVTGMTVEAKPFTQQLKASMVALAAEVDEKFPENAHADIIDDRLVLRRNPGIEPSDEIKTVDALLTERMPQTSVVDVLVDTEAWLNLQQYFKPLSGSESRVEDLRMRLVTTLFCYGFNLGPSQTSQSVKEFNRRQISWLNLKYVTEDVLDKATTQVINAYNKFELPGYWGTGKRASADGTKWNVYEQNLLSEYHIRYGGYGGIGYYHVSDKYIALYSHFIPCGVHEGTYILDGLMANESDIQPDTMHGDTHAQSFTVFGLAHLLGIKLMPRIRNIKDLIFYRPDAGVRYKNIDALFGDPIDWALIETHALEMMRVAVSVKLGKITASTILRRLGTYSQKNKLYFAFRELGRAIRTMFLLRYVADPELRKVIHAATNKSEEYNGLAKWAFFGGGGIIAENVRHEQRKLIKYNHLVVNLVILYNVHHMTIVLRKLQEEGVEITPEVLAGLSPYRTAHLNRFGEYTLDFEREVLPMDFLSRILAEGSNESVE